jgi:hypothetical protein
MGSRTELDNANLMKRHPLAAYFRPRLDNRQYPAQGLATYLYTFDLWVA